MNGEFIAALQSARVVSQQQFTTTVPAIEQVEVGAKVIHFVIFSYFAIFLGSSAPHCQSHCGAQDTCTRFTFQAKK